MPSPFSLDRAPRSGSLLFLNLKYYSRLGRSYSHLDALDRVVFDENHLSITTVSYRFAMGNLPVPLLQKLAVQMIFGAWIFRNHSTSRKAMEQGAVTTRART